MIMDSDISRSVTLEFEDGHIEEIILNPMKVALFPKAWKFTGEAFDEARLLDLAFGRPEGWCSGLKPASYTQATEAMYGTCKDFFGSVARRQAWRAAMAGSS